MLRLIVDLLANTFNAVMGSSMSMSMRSWLKRLSVTPVSTVEKKDIGDLPHVSMFTLPSDSTYPRTVSKSFLWKVMPERGTMVMISCLSSQLVGGGHRCALRLLPAADCKKPESQRAKHGVDAQIESQTLIRMLFIVLRPKFDPYGCDNMISRLL